MYEGFLEASTARSYHQMAEEKKHGIIKCLGKVELKKLNTAMVQKYANFLVKEGLNPKTIKNIVMLIHVIYERAMRLNYVSEKCNIVSKVDLPKVRKKKIESYSEEEVKTLLELVDAEGSEMLKLEVWLAIGTGCRRSELAGIQIEAIDFKNKILHIEQSRVDAGKQDVVKMPKTDSGVRDIPLNDTLIKILKQAVVRYNKNKLKNGAKFVDSRYIFSNEYGKPYRTKTLSRRYSDFMELHKDKIRYLPLHAAGRHTFASLAVANGIDIKALQEILGHADASTTLNTYSNSYLAKKKEYVDVLEKTIFAKEA